jgi:hypothetical protein
MLQEIAEHQGLPTEKYRFLLKVYLPLYGWPARHKSGRFTRRFLAGLSAISLAEMKVLKTIRLRGGKAGALHYMRH